MEGKQRTYLMLAMETLAKEDWPTVFSSSFVSSCSPLVFPLPSLSCASFVLLRICLFREGCATGDEDDGDGDVMLLAEQTLPLFLLIFTCYGRSVFLSLRCWLRYPGLLLRVPVFVSVLSLLRREGYCYYGWCMLTMHNGGCWMLMELEEARSASP